MPSFGSTSLYFAAAAVFVATVVACSSAQPADSGGEDQGSSGSTDGDAASYTRDGSTYDSAPSPDSGLGTLRFQPTKTYSGYDGTHAFQVPVAVYDSASDLKVTASDSSAAVITPTQLVNPVNQDGITDNGKYFLALVKKPGTLTIVATSSGKSTQMTIEVTSYDTARWSTGEARYTSAGTASDQPCTNCHVNGKAIDHSPAALATADDQKIGTTITTGISPFGFPIQGVEGGHKWNVTDAERDGLVTYLRALTPKGFK